MKLRVKCKWSYCSWSLPCFYGVPPSYGVSPFYGVSLSVKTTPKSYVFDKGRRQYVLMYSISAFRLKINTLYCINMFLQHKMIKRVKTKLSDYVSIVRVKWFKRASIFVKILFTYARYNGRTLPEVYKPLIRKSF